MSTAFTSEQEGNARLAEMLRELAPHITDVHLPPINDIPVVWPAENIRERLGDAADLIDALTMRLGVAR